ncbi:MAG: Biotin carboxyl carrier protein of acetyl-CoA carboxylase [uncultured Segetibacter sp.]|uniref:Biotin carboxyl carrier protein of acetyl-CoA carboxylase n=1 Tax=uncultured Segetibacter sp. TaxID=481133 RepID=A0A6J4RS32_9BACT|nr:MAG: Biotin carboxyl carrier protein of acetyl-CoA carboxylase [uncultured Segetibacter sp.]
MDFKQIQELIKIVNRSNIGELRIEEGDFKIIIKQKEEPSPVYAANTPIQSHLAPAPAVQPSVPPVQAASTNSSTAAPEIVPAKQSENFITIKSPMIGTFYRSSGPDKPSFVNIGDEVSVGKTVCIIEAMKLFNEIESEVKGTVVKVLVDDATPVEYDQPLFLVEPA